jgi:hypothetical protein
MGRFISPDTIVPEPTNPQSFNRYSYCLNNPLKYIDPSGLTDVTVEQTPMTPEQIAYLGLLGITDYDTWYTITCAAGNQATIAGNSRVIYVGNLPDAVYNVANEMRKNVESSELNICWQYEDKKGVEYFYYHFTYDIRIDKPTTRAEYWFNGNMWELIHYSELSYGDKMEFIYSSPNTYLGTLKIIAGGFAIWLGVDVAIVGSTTIIGAVFFGVAGAIIAGYGYNLVASGISDSSQGVLQPWQIPWLPSPLQ